MGRNYKSVKKKEIKDIVINLITCNEKNRSSFSFFLGKFLLVLAIIILLSIFRGTLSSQNLTSGFKGRKSFIRMGRNLFHLEVI
jgi:hypothetical protein